MFVSQGALQEGQLVPKQKTFPSNFSSAALGVDRNFRSVYFAGLRHYWLGSACLGLLRCLKHPCNLLSMRDDCPGDKQWAHLQTRVYIAEIQMNES